MHLYEQITFLIVWTWYLTFLTVGGIFFWAYTKPHHERWIAWYQTKRHIPAVAFAEAQAIAAYRFAKPHAVRAYDFLTEKAAVSYGFLKHYIPASFGRFNTR